MAGDQFANWETHDPPADIATRVTSKPGDRLSMKELAFVMQDLTNGSWLRMCQCLRGATSIVTRSRRAGSYGHSR
jgi:hypothetical protein